MLKINRKTPSGQNSPRGLFSKYDHIIYQSISNFMYFQKNIRTMCSHPIENTPQGSIAP